MSGSTSPHLARPIKPHDGAMRADGTQEQSANCEQLSTNCEKSSIENFSPRESKYKYTKFETKDQG